jgi:hypothetical protein
VLDGSPARVQLRERFFADPEAERAVNTLLVWAGDVIQPQALALICASCQISDLRRGAHAANAANPQN